MNGAKHDAGKLKWSLLPLDALREVLRVLHFGADKYGEFNWEFVDNKHERYFNAALRHLTAWWDGELADEESGFSHLAHAACCVLFLLASDVRAGVA